MPRELTSEDWYLLTLPFDYRYYHDLRKKLEKGALCSFCDLESREEPILYENQHWVITQNAFPNKRACAVMLLIISKEHWRNLGEITPEAWASFSQMILWATQHFNLPGGMLFLRFGDMTLNAGTIRHLHWNLWVPNKTGKVFAPIYKSAEEMAADEARAEGFARRYEAGEIPA